MSPFKSAGPDPSPLIPHFSVLKMTHCATQHRPRLWKAIPSPLVQRQNARVGCLSYSFGQSYYHHVAEKLPGVSVRFTPNPQISRYTRTQALSAAWEEAHPLQHLSLSDAQPQSPPVGTSLQGGPSLAFQRRVPALSYMGIGAGISNINSTAPVAASTQGQALWLL